MKVYVITKGCYSDYHICGATTDEEVAKKLVKKYSDMYEVAECEEYESEEIVDDELDDYVDVWHIVINSNGLMVDPKCSGYVNKHREVNSYQLGQNLIFDAYIKEKDKEKAIKIAIDRRAKMLAERLGL